MASIWLVFLIFPVYAVTQDPDPVRRWVGLAVILLFIVAYVPSFITPGIMLEGRARHVQLLRGILMLLFTAVLAWLGPELAQSMTPFLTAFAIWGLWPPLRGAVAVGVLGIGFVLWGLSGWLLPLLFPIGGSWLVAISGIVGVGAEEVAIEDAQRREEQLLTGHRERLARDVHDLVGHTLTVANLKLQLAERLLESDPKRAREELEATRQVVSRAQQELRASVNGMIQPSAAIELAASRRILAEAGIEVTVVGDPATVPASLVLVLGWVLREATTNVLRHSRADHVTIKFTDASLRITDDGVGLHGPAGRGIPGMRQRVEAAGAGFEIHSPSAGGCEVLVTW